MSDLDAIRERHRPYPFVDKHVECAEDEQPWPCDAAQALARVDELEAALRAEHLLVEDAVEGRLAAETRVDELETALRTVAQWDEWAAQWLARPEPKP